MIIPRVLYIKCTKATNTCAGNRSVFTTGFQIIAQSRAELHIALGAIYRDTIYNMLPRRSFHVKPLIYCTVKSTKRQPYFIFAHRSYIEWVLTQLKNIKIHILSLGRRLAGRLLVCWSDIHLVPISRTRQTTGD